MSNGCSSARFFKSSTTRIVGSLLAACLILSAGCSSTAHGFGRPARPKQPPRELCILGNSGCVCFDPRLPEEQQSYILPYEQCLNYVATNPVDYDTHQEWISRNCHGPKK